MIIQKKLHVLPLTCSVRYKYLFFSSALHSPRREVSLAIIDPAGYYRVECMLMSPNEAKQLSMAATTGVIWLCTCVRYWPYRGVGTCASVLKLVLFQNLWAHRSISFLSHLQTHAVCGSQPTATTILLHSLR